MMALKKAIISYQELVDSVNNNKIEVVEAIKELDEGKTRSVLASRFKALRAKLIKQATNDALGAQYVAAQIDQQLNNFCKQISLFEVVE